MVAKMIGRPNPRLQRTPLRAPLSRKPLGGREMQFRERTRQWN
jgi:hypothetical protein